MSSGSPISGSSSASGITPVWDISSACSSTSGSTVTVPRPTSGSPASGRSTPGTAAASGTTPGATPIGLGMPYVSGISASGINSSSLSSSPASILFSGAVSSSISDITVSGTLAVSSGRSSPCIYCSARSS